MPKAGPDRAGSEDPLQRARQAGLDSLFTVHPSGFTSARNAVADGLKKAGDKEAAAAVRALAKPTVPVWGVNQVARKKRSQVEELLEVAEKLGATQQGKGGDLRALSERHRELIRQLRAEVARLLELPATSTSAHLDRAEATLLAAAAGTASQREALRRGELREEVEASGFAVFGVGATPAQAQAQAQAQASTAPAKAQQTKGAGGTSGATRKGKGQGKGSPSASGTTGTAREKAQAAAEAARAAKAAEKEARAAARAAEARQALDRAEREERAAAQTLEKAEAAYQAAEARFTEAQAALADAKSARDSARAEHRKLEATVTRLSR